VLVPQQVGNDESPAISDGWPRETHVFRSRERRSTPRDHAGTEVKHGLSASAAMTLCFCPTWLNPALELFDCPGHRQALYAAGTAPVNLTPNACLILTKTLLVWVQGCHQSRAAAASPVSGALGTPPVPPAPPPPPTPCPASCTRSAGPVRTTKTAHVPTGADTRCTRRSAQCLVTSSSTREAENPAGKACAPPPLPLHCPPRCRPPCRAPCERGPAGAPGMPPCPPIEHIF